nr:hypothetical protein [Candidatus Dojkabacteria bacterium]
EDFAPHVQSFIMILFRETTLKKSFCFLIPIYKYLEFKRMIPKKSANIKDFNKHLQMYLLEPQVGSIYKLNSLK